MAECWEVCLLRQGEGTRERERRERAREGKSVRVCAQCSDFSSKVLCQG